MQWLVLTMGHRLGQISLLPQNLNSSHLGCSEVCSCWNVVSLFKTFIFREPSWSRCATPGPSWWCWSWPLWFPELARAGDRPHVVTGLAQHRAGRAQAAQEVWGLHADPGAGHPLRGAVLPGRVGHPGPRQPGLADVQESLTGLSLWASTKHHFSETWRHPHGKPPGDCWIPNVINSHFVNFLWNRKHYKSIYPITIYYVYNENKWNKSLWVMFVYWTSFC